MKFLFSFSGLLREAAEQKKDEKILSKIRGKDLVAIEGKYHSKCYQSYTGPFRQRSMEKPVKGEYSEHDIVYQEFCRTVMADIVENKKWKILSHLLQKLRELGRQRGYDFSKYRAYKLRNRLEKSYPELRFHQPVNRNKSTVVYVKGTAIGRIIETACQPCSSGTETESDLSPLATPVKQNPPPRPYGPDLHALYTQSLALREVLTHSPALLNDIWPPRAADLGTDVCEKIVPVAMYNVLAWITGASNEPQLDSFVDVSESNHRRILSIVQDIIYLQSDGRKATPKHYCLGMAVRHLTGSTRIIQMLNRFGHCASRVTIASLETSLAELQASRGRITPDEISNNTFVTVVADNIDFEESTLTGEGTTHHTNSIIIQSTGRNDPSGTEGNRPKFSKRKFIADVGEVEITSYAKRPRTGPVCTESVEAAVDVEGSESTDDTADRGKVTDIDILYFLLRSLDQNSELPNWTGFNTLLDRDRNLVQDKVAYLPVIPASPTHYDTLYTLLKRCLAILTELQIPSMVLVCDMAMYIKVQEIRWASRESTDAAFYEKIVLRPGEFHTCMTFLAVLGKKYGTAGLKDLLIEARVIAVGSVNNVLSGKAYNRAVFAHKTLAEALQFLRFQTYLNTCSEEDKNLIVNTLKNLITVFPSSAFTIKSTGPDTSRIIEKYQDFCANKSAESKTFRLWSQYISDVTLLLRYLRATRLRDFRSHLETLEDMLPFFFGYDRQNYARYITAYLKEMSTLSNTHEFVHRHLNAGLFATQRTTHYGFSGIAHDQTIEQTINREVKTAGGLIGVTLNRNCVQKWILSQAERAAILGQCERMTGILKESTVRKDLEKGVGKREKAFVDATIETVMELAINPFTTEHVDLVNIISGTVATDDVADDLLASTEKGSAALAKFRQKIESDSQSFFQPINRLNLKTFGAKIRRKDKAGTEMTQRRLFSRMVILGNKLKLDLRETLSYCLGPVSYPLANENGTLSKTQKSILFHAVLKTWPQPELDVTSHRVCGLVVDCMAIIHGLTAVELPKTMKDLASLIKRKLMRLVNERKATRLDVVFDTYPPASIKNLEHQRRGETGRGSHIVIRPELAVPKLFAKDFLSNGKNKTALIEFLIQAWKSDDVVFDCDVYFAYNYVCEAKINQAVLNVEELASNHVEADTRLILHARHAAQNCDSVAIHSPDTDVFLIALSLIEYFPEECQVYFHAKNNIVHITGIYKSMGTQMAQALIGYHVYTGCDTVSSFKGRGKKRGLDMLLKQKDYVHLFARLGSSYNFDHELYAALEKYTCHLYGQPQCVKVDEARYRMFCVSAPDESLLPPCSDALTLHYQRANYQCAINRAALERLMDIPSPAGHGWIVHDDKIFIRWMSRGSYPPQLSEIQACKCQKSKCATNQCKCRQNGLSCTDLCGCLECQNTLQTEQEVEMEETGADSDSESED